MPSQEVWPGCWGDGTWEGQQEEEPWGQHLPHCVQGWGLDSLPRIQKRHPLSCDPKLLASIRTASARPQLELCTHSAKYEQLPPRNRGSLDTLVV